MSSELRNSWSRIEKAITSAEEQIGLHHSIDRSFPAAGSIFVTADVKAGGHGQTVGGVDNPYLKFVGTVSRNGRRRERISIQYHETPEDKLVTIFGAGIDGSLLRVGDMTIAYGTFPEHVEDIVMSAIPDTKAMRRLKDLQAERINAASNQRV